MEPEDFACIRLLEIIDSCVPRDYLTFLIIPTAILIAVVAPASAVAWFLYSKLGFSPYWADLGGMSYFVLLQFLIMQNNSTS